MCLRDLTQTQWMLSLPATSFGRIHGNRDLNPYYSWICLYTDLPHRSFWFPSRLSWLRVYWLKCHALTQEMNYYGSVQSNLLRIKSSIVPRSYNRPLWWCFTCAPTFLALVKKGACCDVSSSLSWVRFSFYSSAALLTPSQLVTSVWWLTSWSNLDTFDYLDKLGQLKEGPNYVRFLIIVLFPVVLNFVAVLHLVVSWQHLWDHWWFFPPWRTISSCFIAASGC